MSSAFDFISAINFSKEDLMSGTSDDVQAEKEYVPFVTNRTLSYFPDAIMYANEMNNNHHVGNRLQFHYLINSIRPRKRFTKWAKKLESDDLEAVKQYYQYNDMKAMAALSLLSPDQLCEIKAIMNNKGGNENERTGDSVRNKT